MGEVFLKCYKIKSMELKNYFLTLQNLKKALTSEKNLKNITFGERDKQLGGGFWLRITHKLCATRQEILLKLLFLKIN